MKTDIRFNIGAGQRFMAFICICVLCFLVVSVITGIITYHNATTPRIRIATVVQDVMLFVVPAIATAVIICRRPADFLMIGHRPGLLPSLLTVALVVASIPAMNLLVKWNMSLSLPEWLGEVEAWMRNSEVSARSFTRTLIGGTGVSSLIAALLIVGVLAAVSEELFFRGTLQQLLLTSGVRLHLAVWATAFVFSAVHVQFFGFIPRLILGAGFGYIAVWSGNVWLAVIAHFTNNAIAAIGMTVASGNELIGSASQEGGVIGRGDIAGAVISAIFCAVILIALKRCVSQTSCG
ncbi:MAG: CPBP family intramembrane metalloprotease [Muribaculaceae bacterium]|nr:CPBP family intramembrane metalloprotease [Muribaculaceae bacterium]